MNNEEIYVDLHGEKITLKECAEMYGLDYNLLLSEYIETGNINKGINNAFIKQKYKESIGSIIDRVSVDKTRDLFNKIYKNDQAVKDQRRDAYMYIACSDDDVLAFTKLDLISLLSECNLTKPILRGENYDYILNIIEQLEEKECGFYRVSRKDVKRINNILNNYRLPSKLLDNIMDKYLSKTNITDEDINSLKVKALNTVSKKTR